ncbi:hypothetical protein FLJC2902T_15570 [Flavobacterium limnosediminis JC2902]|uniref:Uncharacterized protein n=1 Tax=Flavobacterium limnosediminis JC2902 TaxID=1341181 RepID=V6SPT0_9FLAO|nr:hypothetical protein [Flavobacterium limnosediminis]ESU28212.1 hypothetical protein FLJC2902T_15570 [Flavobacterium limnosediminis JC2902]
MKNYLSALLFLTGIIANAQQKNCDYDIDEKTDSTFIKKTPDYLIHEKDFVNSSDFILFSLINSDGTPYLNFQLLQKSKDFINPKCFDTASKISLQLSNGKIVTLLSAGDICSQLNYNEKEKNNIRMLNNYFLFGKEGYEDLKKYPISLMKVKFATETVDYVFKKEFKSEKIKGEYFPENYFINYLNCVE